MQDILISVPEFGGDKICLSHYWLDDTEGEARYTVCDSDGNHTDIDESDVPTAVAADRLWLAYAQHVLATGQDPLGEYMVRRRPGLMESWQVQARLGVGGVHISARRPYGGPYLTGSRLPAHVRSYFLLPDGSSFMPAGECANLFALCQLAAVDGWKVTSRGGRVTLRGKLQGPDRPYPASKLRTAARKHARDLRQRIAEAERFAAANPPAEDPGGHDEFLADLAFDAAREDRMRR